MLDEFCFGPSKEDHIILFCNKYKALCSSVLSDSGEMAWIAECIESSVSQAPSTVTEHLIDVSVIMQGVKKLKQSLLLLRAINYTEVQK